MRYIATTTDPMPDLIDLSEIAGWVRVDGDDPVLQFLLRAAMFWAEGFCDQALFARNYTATLPCFSSYGRIPGISATITGVVYDTFTLDSAAYKLSDRNVVTFLPGSVSGLSANSISLSYTAGYSGDALPEDIKLALFLVVSNMYDNRSNPVSEKRTAAENLLQNYKLY